MKSLYTYSVVIFLAILLSYSNTSFSQTGIFQSYLTLDYNGSLNYLDDASGGFNPKGSKALDGQFLGTFNSGDVFELAGADIHTYKNSGVGNDVTGAELNYSVYKVGGIASFSAGTLGFCCNSGNALCIDGVTTCDTGLGADDQKWFLETLGVDLLAGLDPGDYTLEVFYKAYTNLGDRYENNSGANYKATFSVGTDGFSDGNLTSGPVWSGETSSFSILDPTSLSGSGSNSNINGTAVTNDEVLVSNASAADAVVTTPSNMAYGSWQFSLATGSGWNTSESNGTKVFLISDTDDVLKLKDGAYDFNGYVVEFGNDANTSMDTLALSRINGSTKTKLISTTYPGTPNLIDGYRIKVTRDYAGNWELFADQGFDGPAASTSRGTAVDNAIKTSDYFGLGTEITNPGTSRRAYFDNISLNGNTEISFDSSSSDSDETDGSIIVNLDIVNPSLTDATTADVVLIKGDPTRIDSYSTQSFTFAAGASASQPLTITITDNDDCDYNTSIVLEIQNVAGGMNGAAHGQTTFTLNLTDDNTSSENEVNDDFEDADLVGWTGETTLFSNQATTELSGAQALYSSNVSGDNISYLVNSNDIKDLNGATSTWRFSAATGLKDPNDLNRFTVFLTSNGEDPTSSGIQGYAVALNEGGNTDDRLRLYRIDSNISATEIIKYEIPNGWGSFDNFAIEVIRDEAGNWEMYINDEADFSALIPAAVSMPVLDNTYDFMGSTIVVSHQDDVTWDFWFDDLSVTQEFCSGVYETTGTGNSSGAIWQLVGTTTPATPPFNKYTDIIVKNGDVLTLDSDVRTGLVTIEPLGEMDLGTGDYELEIFGDLTIDGLLTSNKGAISMIGNSGAQSVSGSAIPDFYEFNANNSSGVNFSSDAKFYGPIHPQSGTLNFGTQTIHLASDDIGGEILTGSISEIASSADVTGQITMERYVESVDEGYRLIGLPITSQTVSGAFSGDFLLTGFAGSDYPGQDFTNLKYYDETDVSCNLNDGFIDVMSMSEAIDSDKGYWAYMPAQASNYVLNSTGSFNKGDITVNLDYTTGCDAQTIGWNCIANPYPSAIDIMSSEIVLVNCERSAYILDHTLGSTWKGEYVSYINGVSNNGGSNILSSYQGFFVRATGPGASITFKEGCKVDDQAGFLRFDDASRELIRFSINSEEYKYETVVSFHDQATSGYDNDFDGYFLESNSIYDGGLTLSTLMGENTLSVNTLNELTEPLSVTFRTIVPTQGEYQFTLDALQNISESVCLIIEDTETDEFYPVSEGTEITFTAPSDNYQTERFVLHAHPGAEYTSYMASCNGAADGEIDLITPEYANWNVEWFDVNDVNLNSTSDGNSNTVSELSSGTYTAVLTSDNENCSVIEENIEIFEPAAEELSVITISSVCSENNGQVITELSNSNAWTVSAFEDGLLIAESTGTVNVSLGELSGSAYTIEITSECTTEELTFNLKDENEVIASFESNNELVLEGTLVPFTASNSSENGVYFQWFINGELVSESENLNYEFDTLGQYEIRLVSANDFCSSETTDIITVSAVDSILETELVVEILNLTEGIQITTDRDIQNASVKLYDAAGREVLNEGISGTTNFIFMDNLSTGIYTLLLLDENSTISTVKLNR